jgi:protein involved in polysaccharide export with SLBB domain
MSLLSQKPPDLYQLAPGDVLGVWIEGVLGEANLPLPIQSGSTVLIREQRRIPPALGYPIPVREDGTIALPLVDPISVKGLSIAQAQDAIRRAYTADKQIIRPGRERIIVSLMHPRQYHVVVIRQESANFVTGPEGIVSTAKRGTGHEVDLPAYENDVLHALAQTGGLPGLDAFDEIVVQRGYRRAAKDDVAVKKKSEAHPSLDKQEASTALEGQTIRIPLRTRGGEPAFGPEDVVLRTGDTVFLEARDQDVFFSAGLLPAGEHVLPRDVDLDVIGAIARVRGPLVNGGFAVSNLSGALIAPGIGNPSPSLLTVVRRTPGGGQVAIRVDLNRALCDSRERILVQAGDVLILQETPSETLARYFSQTFLNFNLAWQVIHESFATGVLDISAPDRLGGRLETKILPP